VVNSRPGIDSWRFSHETVMRLQANQKSVKFLDLSSLDPSVSIVFLIRKFFRNFFNSKNYEKSILEDLILKQIEILKLKPIQKLLYFFDYSGVPTIFSAAPTISKENEVAVRSWLAITSGSTHYSWKCKTRANLFRAQRSVNWSKKYFDTYISKQQLDGIFTFNGRFPVDSTLLTRANESGIPSIVFDGGSLAGDNRNRIQYFASSPHNPIETRVKILEYWEAGQAPDRARVADEYLKAISEGKRNLGTSFEWNENPAKESVNCNKSVVFFASSDWEQGAIMKWLPVSGFKNQFEVVDALSEICTDLDLNLLLKLHPIRKNFNGKQSIKAEEAAWSKYSSHNRIQIVSQDLGARASDLISNSLINVGFRTSVTAQSIYAGKYTAVCGQVPWVKDDSTYLYAPDKQRLKSLIEGALSYAQIPIDLLTLHQWAYYQAVCGSPMRFSEIVAGQFRVLSGTRYS
jgi:hypothetical protein